MRYSRFFVEGFLMKWNVVPLIALLMVSGLAFSGVASALGSGSGVQAGDSGNSVIYPPFGSDFELEKDSKAVIGDYTIVLREVLIPANSGCSASVSTEPVACEFGRIQAVLEVSKSSGDVSVGQKVYLYENSPQSVLGISIAAKSINPGSVVLNVSKEQDTPEPISPKLGESFALLQFQQASIQENGDTVMKLSLERIDNSTIYCIKAPCPSGTYAVMTASLAQGGIYSFKVRLGESYSVGDFTVSFDGQLEGCGVCGNFTVARNSTTPADIYVYLDQPFKLVENQGAVFKQGEFRIDLSEIGFTVVCQGTNCPPSENYVTIGISTIKEGLVGSALVQNLKEGESVDWGDYTITLQAIAADYTSAKFLIASKIKPTPITAYLDEKFKISTGEKAMIFEGRELICIPEDRACNDGLLSFKLDNIVRYKCGVDSSGEYTSSSDNVKCIGSKPVATVDITEYSESGWASTGAVLNIAQGSKASFGQYDVWFLESSGNTGVFLVKKSVPDSEYRKVYLDEKFSLLVKQKALVVGEDVFIKLNLIGDAKIDCYADDYAACIGKMVANISVSKIYGSAESGQNYTLSPGESVSIYGLDISLLDIATEPAKTSASFIVTKQSDPKVINVHINEPFKLLNGQAARVLEANLRIDVLNLMTVCASCSEPSSDSTGAAPSCIGGPCISQVEFSVSNYALEKAEIGKTVSSKVIQETVISETSTSESISGASGITGNAILEDSRSVEIPPTPWKTYILEAGQSVIVGDFEIQVLSVTGERAEFLVLKKSSGISFNYVFKTGFNLISTPGTVGIASSNCESSNAFVLFEYDAQSKTFRKVDSVSSGRAYWLFNPGKSCEAKATIRQKAALSDVPMLYKGWNFVPIVPEMVGKKITDFGCSISSAYYWNASSLNWEKVLTKTINASDYGKGFAVKADADCRLASEDNEQPPMPGPVPVPETSEAISAKAGEEFEIRLVAATDGGYSWAPEPSLVSVPYDGIIEYVGSDTDFSACPSNAVGCNGTNVLTFRALRAGETQILLKEYREWGGEDSAIDSKTFSVVVE